MKESLVSLQNLIPGWWRLSQHLPAEVVVEIELKPCDIPYTCDLLSEDKASIIENITPTLTENLGGMEGGGGEFHEV